MASFSYDCISEYRQYSISRAPLKARMNDYLICNISNMRDSVSSGYPILTLRKELKLVENATRNGSGVFLTKFEMFGKPMKHYLECLIYRLNRNKN